MSDDPQREAALRDLRSYVDGTFPRQPGHDRKIEARIMLVFGRGNSEAGRKLLAELALAAASEFNS